MNRLSLSVVLTILCSSPLTAQWVQIGLPDRGIGEIAIGTTGMFAITSDSGSVFRSTDGGMNWLQVIHSTGAHIAVAPNGSIFMAMGDSVYRSIDGGNSWTNLHAVELFRNRFGWFGVKCVAVAPYGLVFLGFKQFTGMGPSYIGMSTDNGLSWTTPGEDTLGGIGFAFRGDSIITYGEAYYMDYGVSGSFRVSSDSGRTWDGMWGGLSLQRMNCWAWCSNGNILACGSGCAWFEKPDLTGVFSPLIASSVLALPNGKVLVGTDTTGIYLFTDNGDSLGTRNEGLTDLHIHTFAMDSSGYVYAGTNNGIWRRTVSDLIVSVSPIANRLPNEFILEQSFPNPFNPVTNIQFTIANRQLAIVKVYDVLGSEVATLVNEVKEPGTYSVEFDASGLASGVYFYRLRAGSFVSTKRMLVLK